MMKPHLQREIEQLKRKVLELGALVEDCFLKAVRAVITRDAALAREIMQSDELIDQKEVLIEEDCLKILALYQPVAIDLRFVIAALKINNDLERIGDLAVNIAEQVSAISSEQGESPIDVNAIAEKVHTMFRQSLDSLVNMDVRLAHRVCAADDEIDAMHRRSYKVIEEETRKSPERIDYLIHFLSVSRYLERIADYATNVAEDVVYMCEGQIIRHKKAHQAPL